MKPFLRWWIIVAGVITGIGFMIVYDCINYVNNSDVTKLSFVIFALFVYSTVRVGMSTYRRDKNIYDTHSDLSVPRFMVSVLKLIGMLGTVIGFILMLSTCLGSVNFQNVQSMQTVISSMTTGMSTALVTTAAGLVCSLILELQIFNFDEGSKT